MLGAILLILVVLWFFGYIHIQGISIPNFPLFVLNGHSISLWDLLIFLVILWAIESLPGPLRVIAGVLLVLWLLSTLGLIAIVGFSHLIVVVIIIGLVLAVLHVI
ncbi:MAG TPA: hypothetical protein VMR81_01345 [Patescibacteria group bacterium]|jgi:hypothetical protein|nr:hypothetical protein [Patescibacteria group bacterium]